MFGIIKNMFIVSLSSIDKMSIIKQSEMYDSTFSYQ